MICFRSQPFPFSEKIEHDANDGYHYGKDKGIPPLPFQLRHIFEIHPVEAGEKGEGDKNSGDNGQNFHPLVQPVAER